MKNKIKWHGPAKYRIKVMGQLTQQWSKWFDNMKIESGGNESTLTGNVADQAALHGLLASVRDLGLPLISLQRLDNQPGKEKQ